MSYGYGGRRGRRGGGGGRRYGDGNDEERWERGAGSGNRGYQRNSGWESRDEQGRGGGGGVRGKHPPHLKGREIGLWYSKFGGLKRSEMERKSVSICPYLNICFM